MDYRRYDPGRDGDAARRVWRECGWLEPGREELIEDWIESTRALVAEVNGDVESMVLTTPGTVRYLGEDLRFSAVTGVTTSRIARKQGLASALLARALAADAEEGAVVAGLGMFEQGFYDRLGFGTLGYVREFYFDPAQLRVSRRLRIPRRLSAADWQAIHESRLRRGRGHGAVSLDPAAATRGDLRATEHGFGLGYADGGAGELTHHLWCGTREVESGPYEVKWLAYQTLDQLMELLALLKSLGDQVHSLRMQEPPGIQLQDLLGQPLRTRQITRGGRMEQRISAGAYYQMRILDLPACLSRTFLPGVSLRFNLRISDPLDSLLPDDATWRSAAGSYVVTLGAPSWAEPGNATGLPILEASVGAFTRLWLGVRPATSLAATDALAGPLQLLEALDRSLRLPEMQIDWEY